MSGRPAVYAHTAAGGPDEILRQVFECGNYLMRQGFDNCLNYEDSAGGRSGRDSMLADVDAGKVSTVVVWALDRLFRKPEELGPIRTRLEAAGCELHTATEGRISLEMVGVLASMAASFHSDVSSDREQAEPVVDGHRIRLYCDDPIGNEPEPARTWIADLLVSPTDLKTWSGASWSQPRRVTPRWVDSDSTMVTRYSDGHGERARWQLPCIHCGRRDIYREDRLHQFLTRVTQQGLAEISLRAIASWLPEQ